MNQNQINRKEMYDTVIAYLDANTGKWSSVLKVVEFKNEFTTVVSQIEQSQEAQMAAQVFLGKNKEEMKESIAHKADILNDSLEVMALVAGDEELRSRMNASYSDLFRLPYADFIPAVKEIITAAETYSGPLQTDYGVTTAQIDDLKNSFDDFLQINGQPRLYKVASVQATKSLEQLFTDATNILENKLDKVMSIFKQRDKDFYNGYQAARVVVDK